MAPSNDKNTAKKRSRIDVDLTQEDDEEGDRKPAALPRKEYLTRSEGPVGEFRTDAEFALALLEKEEDEPPRKRAARMPSRNGDFTCPICLSDDIEDVEHQTYSLSACGHAFCFVCLEQLVQTSSAVGSATAEPIPCPMAPGECSHSLTLGDIQTILQYSPKTLSLYSEATSMAFLEDQVTKGTARRCPNKTCNFTFEYEGAVASVAKNNVAAKKGGATRAKAAAKAKGKKGPKKKAQPKLYPNGCLFQCPQCYKNYCLDCGANGGKVGPSHQGTCEDRFKVLNMTPKDRQELKKWEKINSEADERFRALLKRESARGKTKACPKCFRLITKNRGCDHMYCTGCKRRFNWSQAPTYKG